MKTTILVLGLLLGLLAARAALGATFTVTTAGATPFTYSLTLNGSVISNLTKISSQSTYTFTVTNAAPCGSATAAARSPAATRRSICTPTTSSTTPTGPPTSTTWWR